MEVDADQNSIFWHLFDEASAIDGGLMAFPDFLEEEGDYPLGRTDAAVPTFSSGSDELLPLPDCLDYKAIPLSCLPQPPELGGMGNCSPELEWDYVQCLAGPCTPQPELLIDYDHPGECRLLESLPAKRRRSRSGEIGMEEIRAYFDMPITRAATKMNVGLTVLKKRCRDLGISRWPHRKMKSLNTLIQNIQELGKITNDGNIKEDLEALEEHRRLMEGNPEIQLTEKTKKLRQACFKANYKKRRANHLPCLPLHQRISFN